MNCEHYKECTGHDGVFFSHCEMCNPLEQKTADGWAERFDELLKTFNIENRKPTDYEVSVESAVKQFIRTELAAAEQRGVARKGEEIRALIQEHKEKGFDAATTVDLIRAITRE